MFPFTRTLALFLIFSNVASCFDEYPIKPFFRSDYQFVEQAGGWIKFHRVPTSWTKARTRCQIEGADLMSPSNQDLLGGMLSVLNNTKSAYCGVFTGIHSLFVEGEFHSIEGVPLSKIPVDINIYRCGVDLNDCMALLPSGYLKSVECGDSYTYMCYRKLTELKLNECGTPDQEYKFSPKTGSCYKFHTDKKTWPEAFKTCSVEGGHLAIINSPDEAEVLKNMFNLYAFLGFRKWNENWYTIHGQTISEAGYASWASKQPDHTVRKIGNGETEIQSCGAMFDSGLLDDDWCNHQNTFICEMEQINFQFY